MANAKKILVPFDGSKHSALSLFYALELASLLGDKIVLFHVLKGGRVKHDEKVKALSLLKSAKEKAAQRNVECGVEVAVGDPADEIIKESLRGYRQIVMGSHGEGGGIEKVFVGSVAERVIKKSSIPVTVVK